MPINIPNDLPAKKELNKENIFVMTTNRATTQDIRPLRIGILNIMPTKLKTETQLLRLLSNTPLQVDVTLIHPKTHLPKNVAYEHLKTFYKSFDDIKDTKMDGFIITGAPVEKLEFEDVNYWDELKEIFEWTKHNVYSTLFICWGAQAGLNYYYDIPKYPLDRKLSGVFENTVKRKNIPLFRGFDDSFNMPHSRYTEIRKEDIKKHEDLRVVCESDEAGISVVMGKKGRQIYVMGHSEYDYDTLKEEYERDLAKGINPEIPKHYFPGNNPKRKPKVKWKAHANLLFYNWLNYYVYQATPFNLSKLK